MDELDELIAAVCAHLTRITPATLHEVLSERGTADAQALGEALRDMSIGDPQARAGRYLLGWLHWYRSRVATGEQRAWESGLAALNFLPLFADPFWQPPELPDPLPAQLALRTIPIATNENMPIDARIVLWRRIIAAEGEGHADHPGRLAYLSLLLHERCADARGQDGLADLEEAISAARRAIALTPEADARRPMYQVGLISLLILLADRTDSPEALDEAVEVGRLAGTAAGDDDPIRGAVLSLFGVALFRQAALSGSLATIEELVAVSREALRSGDSQRGPHWALFGNALQARFERVGDLADLDEAVRAHREAVACTGPDDHTYAEVLGNLSRCLRLTFAWTGSVDALSEAVMTAREAVSAGVEASSDWGTCLMTLGVALLARFERFGAISDGCSSFEGTSGLAFCLISG